MVLGRTHIKDVASQRKVELSSYVPQSDEEFQQKSPRWVNLNFLLLPHNFMFDILQNINCSVFSLISGRWWVTNCVTQINVQGF